MDWTSAGKATRGEQAERGAERYLIQQGLRLQARNYRCKAGEIDLVMLDQDTLVFVEVRLRSHRGFATAAESVDWRKQQKLTRAAQHYLQRHRLTDRVACRFDVLAFDPNSTASPGTDSPGVSWVKNAFGGA